ncbi:MAG: thioredoxin [Brevinematia bacterium]
MSNVVYASASNFESEVLKSSIPVVVDFWAEWCPPCRMIAPLLDQLADEYAGKAKIVKINVDNDPEIATTYNITNIPTLIFFNKGTPYQKIVGAVPKQRIKEVLDSMLSA